MCRKKSVGYIKYVDRRCVDLLFLETYREVTIRRRDVPLRHLKAGKCFKLTGRKSHSKRPWIKWYVEYFEKWHNVYWTKEELLAAKIEAEELVMLFGES